VQQVVRCLSKHKVGSELNEEVDQQNGKNSNEAIRDEQPVSHAPRSLADEWKHREWKQNDEGENQNCRPGKSEVIARGCSDQTIPQKKDKEHSRSLLYPIQTGRGHSRAR